MSEKLKPDRLAWALFVAALLIYAGTRLFRIEAFPIYFFCDEAVHSVQFHAMVANGWHAIEAPNELLPAYFNNGGMPNLSLSVYLQGTATLIFGQTVEVVRTTSAFVSLSAAFAIALMLRRVFQLREWWSVVLFLTVIPCWFLHTRTGFETVLMVSSYSWFLYFYLRYRYEDPRWVYAAAVAGAATFYSYAPGQGVIGLTALLLLISDAKYHWRQRTQVMRGFVFSLVLLAPFARFRLQHPEMMQTHLSMLNSYWVRDLSLGEKLRIFGGNYLEGFSPRYWFAVGGENAVRHIVPNKPYLPVPLAPLALAGLGVCVVRFRESCYRLTLIALVVAPFSSALVAPGITRMLSMVVAFSLLATIGFSRLLSWVETRGAHQAARLAAFGLLAVSGLGLLRGALIDGPTASRDYGLYGLQWGSTAVYRDLLPRYVKTNPEARFFITHITSNSPEVFPEFFGWMDRRRVFFASLDDICKGYTLPEETDLVLISAGEFETLKQRPEVARFNVIERIRFPDGLPAYYLGRLLLEPDFVVRVTRERGADMQPPTARVVAGDRGFSVAKGGVAGGRVQSLFAAGGADVSGMPGETINLQVYFDEPLRLKRIRATREAMPGTRVSIWATRHDVEIASAIGDEGGTSAELSLDGREVDYVRVEFTGKDGLVVRPSRIEILP